jgi:DNA-directed RNA polymerase sigma subunit (sigma70/sigma32)
MWDWYHGERGVCLTREEVAKRMRITSARVYDIEMRALKKLRRRLTAAGMSLDTLLSGGSKG